MGDCGRKCKEMAGEGEEMREKKGVHTFREFMFKAISRNGQKAMGQSVALDIFSGYFTNRREIKNHRF